MNKLGIEEGIIKVIDGEMYYKSHYCYWLYTQLEEMQNRIDEAIEYIEQVNKDKDQVPYLIEGETLKLLEILRGGNNDK